MRADFILLHPPTVYDFRNLPIMYGPISDVVPSTPIFEMYPIGFFRIAGYLEKNGYKVRVINIAFRMLHDPKFNAERLIRNLRPSAFGIDLHWLAHAQGCLELAKLIKACHQNIPVIIGGLSASYYHEELIKCPQIDCIIRGDAAEEPTLQLLRSFKNNRLPEDVPNLTWKDKNGKAHINPISYVPAHLDDALISYKKIIHSIIHSVIRHRDLLSYTPYANWSKSHLAGILLSHGCMYNCITCGGSSFSSQRICNRKDPVYRDPDLVAEDIKSIASYMKSSISILGNIQGVQYGYAKRLLRAIKQRKIRNQIRLEIFFPAERELLEEIAGSIKNFVFQMSPESHDEKIRKAFGRPYSNEALERMIKTSIELGCKRLDLFFMIGLPYQTPESVQQTISYCRTLLEKYGKDKKIHPYIAPLAPFLDPGSIAFEQPEKYGYKLFYKTLEEHRQALLAPSWKYTLNYETEWMSRDQIVEATYEANLKINRLKLEYGLLDVHTFNKLEARINQSMEIMRKIDRLMLINDQGEKVRQIEKLKLSGAPLDISSICDKNELRELLHWPIALFKLNILKLMWDMIF